MDVNERMSQYQSYNMARMFMDFPPELLAQGAEWYLSEDPKIEIIDGVKNPEAFWIRPDAMRQSQGKSICSISPGIRTRMNILWISKPNCVLTGLVENWFVPGAIVRFSTVIIIVADMSPVWLFIFLWMRRWI